MVSPAVGVTSLIRPSSRIHCHPYSTFTPASRLPPSHCHQIIRKQRVSSCFLRLYSSGQELNRRKHFIKGYQLHQETATSNQGNHQKKSIIKMFSWVKDIITRMYGGSIQLPSDTILVVIGCTGTGKSKLAIDLAKKFNGEVINADAMQVYKGLDIVTNKSTKEEMDGVPHHLMDIVDPLDKISVVEYRNSALAIIDDLRTRKKIPVICGGTNYYIESILYDILMDDVSYNEDLDEKGDVLDPDLLTCDNIMDFELNNKTLMNVPSEKLHQLLEGVDKNGAERLHPNDRRKVINALIITQKAKTTYSNMIQQNQTNGSNWGGPLRFPKDKVLLLWACVGPTELHPRLNKRVEKMVENGMMTELVNFHSDYNLKRGGKGDYTEGIFQAIGFKEFHDYLTLTPEEKMDPDAKTLLAQCVDNMQRVTRRYARKQYKWLTNRMEYALGREVHPMWKVDCSSNDKPELYQNMLEQVVSLVKAQFLTQPIPQMDGRVYIKEVIQVENPIHNERGSFKCEKCDIVFTSSLQYEAHIGSGKHKKRRAGSADASEGVSSKKLASDQVILPTSTTVEP